MLQNSLTSTIFFVGNKVARTNLTIFDSLSHFLIVQNIQIKQYSSFYTSLGKCNNYYSPSVGKKLQVSRLKRSCSSWVINKFDCGPRRKPPSPHLPSFSKVSRHQKRCSQILGERSVLVSNYPALSPDLFILFQ